MGNNRKIAEALAAPIAEAARLDGYTPDVLVDGIAAALDEKDAEIEQLSDELETARAISDGFVTDLSKQADKIERLEERILLGGPTAFVARIAELEAALREIVEAELCAVWRTQ